MRPTGTLEVREYEMFPWVGTTGGSTDADAGDPDSADTEALDDAEASEGLTLTGVDLKTW